MEYAGQHGLWITNYPAGNGVEKASSGFQEMFVELTVEQTFEEAREMQMCARGAFQGAGAEGTKALGLGLLQVSGGKARNSLSK